MTGPDGARGITVPDVAQLEGAVVLVTGGSRGLGAAVARRAASQAAAGIAVTGRDEDAGRRTVAQLREAGANAEFLRVDLADAAQAASVVPRTVERFGRVDAVVNAAGLTTRGSMLDTTAELFDQHVAVNLRAPFLVMSEAIKHLRGRSAPGSIVNVISLSAHGGQPYLAPYVAAKAGLAGLTRNAAHAHRWDRIRVNGVNIGWTDTEGEDRIQRETHGAQDGWQERAAAELPAGRLGDPEEIAEFLVFLLSGRSGVVTGSVVDWDQTVVGGYD